MLKSMIIACLSVVALLGSTLEAQIFRRFAAPRQAPPQVSPYAQQSRGYQPYGGYAAPQRTYYRRVQVAPGRFALVPVQPNATAPQAATTPQDIARQQPETNAKSGQQQADKPISLEGPKSDSPLVAQPRRSPAETQNVQQAQQPRQMYRRVTVYNARTGQRSVRLIPVPPNSLSQQPYVYGQNRAASGPSQQQSNAAAKVVTGTLLPPVQTSKVPASAESIRSDSQVQQATFDDSRIQLGQPNVASVAQTVAPEPQPAIVTPVAPEAASSTNSVSPADGQYSVLDFDDETDDGSSGVGGLELSAPAN